MLLSPWHKRQMKLDKRTSDSLPVRPLTAGNTRLSFAPLLPLRDVPVLPKKGHFFGSIDAKVQPYGRQGAARRMFERAPSVRFNTTADTGGSGIGMFERMSSVASVKESTCNPWKNTTFAQQKMRDLRDSHLVYQVTRGGDFQAAEQDGGDVDDDPGEEEGECLRGGEASLPVRALLKQNYVRALRQVRKKQQMAQARSI